MKPLLLQKNAGIRLVRSIMFLLCLTCLSAANAFCKEQPVYVFAVLPQQPPVVMHKNWRPLLDQLTRDTGVEFKLKLYETMAQFEEDTLMGVPDLIFTTPPMTVIAHKQKGYNPLVRGAQSISGVLFVARDSPIVSVKELDGSSVAFAGSRNVCSIIVRDALANNAVGVRNLYEGSRANVVKSVLLGKAQAGATLNQDLAKDPQALSQVRIIMETAKFPPHPVSAHPRLPKKLVTAITTAILKMNDNENGKTLLKAAGIVDPIKATYDKDYKRLESIDVVGLSKE